MPSDRYSSDKRVLFVHPVVNLLNGFVLLPFSVPALIKRVPMPIHGCYDSELSADDVRRADAILMDVHWYHQLKGALELAKWMKEVNPNCTIVTGGITASLYARVMVDRFDFDYVIRGDAEFSLPLLVMALLEGQSDLSSIPNLIGKMGFETPWTYALKQKDFNENDFLYFDFFPSFKSDLERFHASKPGWPVFSHPYIIPFRGCPVDCNCCAGSVGEQKKIFHRTAVIRSAGKVAEDLDRMNQNPHFYFVNSYLDFVTIMHDSYLQEVLRKPTRLKIHHEFAAPPSMDKLELLLSSFKGGAILFSMDDMHNTSAEAVETSLLIPLIKRVQNTPGYTSILAYVKQFAQKNRNYRGVVHEVFKETRCYLLDASQWWEDAPMPREDGSADPATFETYLNISWKRKFSGSIIWNRVGVFLGRLLPQSWHLKLVHLGYRIFHNLPFRLRFT